MCLKWVVKVLSIGGEYEERGLMAETKMSKGF